MSLIYEPRGKAREYSPLALNLYSGCDHSCKYCYVPAIMRKLGDYIHERVKPRVDVLRKLKRELAKGAPERQILLSFTGDPYCKADVQLKVTREALTMLNEAGAIVAVLTKAGPRLLRDLDLFSTWRSPLKVGATLTFWDPEKSREIEPNAALPGERIATLRRLKEAGVRTWVSIEPVVDPVESLRVMQDALPYTDEYMIGKLNHVPNETDWTEFLRDAVAFMRQADKPFYVKYDLRKFRPGDLYLSPDECDMDYLALRRDGGQALKDSASIQADLL